METSEKGFVPTLLLCLFLGGLGIHAFYVGRIVKGILRVHDVNDCFDVVFRAKQIIQGVVKRS